MKKISNFILVGLVFLLAEPVLAEPDYSVYDRILRDHVQNGSRQGINGTIINYRGIASDSAWPSVVTMMENYPVASLQSRNEKLAFYLNLYNIFVLDLIQKNPGISSINDLSGRTEIWHQPVGTVGGVSVSLNQLQYEYIKPLDNPYMHFALVCGALSCPDLRREAYRSENLSRQLSSQALRFINNSSKGLEVENGAVKVSRIFEWYAEDFGGEAGVREWLTRYMRSGLPEDYRIDYKEYNWDLNGR